MKHYQTYNNYLKKRFGEPVLKIPLFAGFSCPNINGTKSSGGCIYCDNVAFSPVAQSTAPVMVQLKKGIARAKRFKRYIGYFQAFSNTYAPVDQLKNAYEPVISFPNVVGIAIGTRSDCFDQEIFDYLADINRRTYLSVEIGLQTCHNSTLKLINRQHSFEDSVDAIKRLSEWEIETVVHIMLGLPGESREMMMETAKKIAALPISGVKIHQLMVIKNTRLEKDYYLTGKLNPLTLEQYAELVGEFLSHLRPDQIIHRLMADSRVESGLVAPLWSANKTNSLRFIQNYLQQNHIFQGSNYQQKHF